MERGYIDTEKLSVGYGKKTLIRDIALHVRRGEIVTLIGPNGAGKSTLLKIIVGEEDLDYFDQFVSEWTGAGGDIITEEVNEAIRQ